MKRRDDASFARGGVAELPIGIRIACYISVHYYT